MITAQPNPDSRQDLLDSWKEIAAYFGRRIRTVQLWEKGEALPIHRHVHKARGTVHAFRSELESWKLSRQSCVSQPQNTMSIIVIPFETLMPKKLENTFTEGLAEDLITNLGRLQSERVLVIARPPRMANPPTHRQLQRLGKSCNADYILAGSVRCSKGKIRVCAQLIRSRDLTYVWTDSFDEPEAEMITVQSNIAAHITRSLVQVLLLRSNSPMPASNSAFEAYLRGRYYWNKRTARDLKRAVSYFEQAISANPQCSLAYAGLADSYNLLGFYGELAPQEAKSLAKSAATRALAIDDGLAEAHASLAEAHFGFDWDWTSAEHEFKRAIELNPAYPTAHHWYGNFLSTLGRHQEAIVEVQRAHQLDPLSLVINVWLGVVLQQASRYDEAIRQYKRTLELDSNFPMAHAYLALAYEQTKSFDEAIATYQKALFHSGGHVTIKAMLGHTYAVWGKKEQARQILNELEALSGRTHFCPTDVALIYNGLGERQNALNWLERAYDEHCPGMVSLKTEPRLSSLRAEPQFQRLVRRVRARVH
jgi:TolB-like protein/Flp pilus assembly protein TadD